MATVVDTFQVMTNFEVGHRIVEHEQRGAKREADGDLILSGLSFALTNEFGRGYSTTNLKLMRQFFPCSVAKLVRQPLGNCSPPQFSSRRLEVALHPQLVTLRRAHVH